MSPSLPTALREQIETELASNPHKRRRLAPGRKQVRKQARQERKQRKAQFFTQPKPISSQREAQKKLSPDEPSKRTIQLQITTQNNKIHELKAASASSLGREKKLITPSSENDPEDARIHWLESKLKIISSFTKKSKPFKDGLDDLMDDLDRIAVPVNSREAAISELPFFSEAEEEKIPRDEDDLQSDHSDFKGFSSDVYIDPSANPEVSVECPQINTLGLAMKADINHKQTHYVPPHLRNANNDPEKLMKLVRQLKGLLNRLSEANLAGILSSIEEIYREYPRHDVTSSITRLIMDTIALHSSHLDTFVVLYATLVGALYKLVGVEFAAHLVQSLNDTYHHYYHQHSVSFNSERENEAEVDPSVYQGKECLNLVVLLSELYNFQVISCVLVYDIIRELLDRLNEMDVELLLKILRNSGQQLRQDDPSALKNIVDIVHSKVAEQNKSIISSRVQFMVETLTNLKNNKLKRSAYADAHIEQLERMKKFLTGLDKKRHVGAQEPLRVTLDDLHSAEKRGKWWLIGAAWNGNPLVEKANEIQQASSHVQRNDSLWRIARKQGMNTDVRRSIFVVLMSSDDYIDACERLSQLNLSEVQQREIIRVVLHCLKNEKQYNPYYTLVLQQLTHNSHSSRITLQYCFWDFLRQMGEKQVGGAEILKTVQSDEPDILESPISNHIHLAQAFAWLIAKDGSSLSILKPVDFTRLRPQTKIFMRNLFFHIFLSSQVSSPAITLDQSAVKYLAKSGRKRDVLEQVFTKAARVPTLSQGLIYFIVNVLGDFYGDNEVISEVLGWSRDIVLNTLRGTLDIDRYITTLV